MPHPSEYMGISFGLDPSSLVTTDQCPLQLMKSASL